MCWVYMSSVVLYSLCCVCMHYAMCVCLVLSYMPCVFLYVLCCVCITCAVSVCFVLCVFAFWFDRLPCLLAVWLVLFCMPCGTCVCLMLCLYALWFYCISSVVCVNLVLLWMPCVVFVCLIRVDWCVYMPRDVFVCTVLCPYASCCCVLHVCLVSFSLPCGVIEWLLIWIVFSCREWRINGPSRNTSTSQELAKGKPSSKSLTESFWIFVVSGAIEAIVQSKVRRQNHIQNEYYFWKSIGGRDGWKRTRE